MASCSITELATLVALSVGFLGLFMGVVIGVLIARSTSINNPESTL